MKLHAPFALAQDTANILGVSDARLAALRKILADAAKPVERAAAASTRKRKSNKHPKRAAAHSAPRKVSAKKK